VGEHHQPFRRFRSSEKASQGEAFKRYADIDKSRGSGTNHDFFRYYI
jgi:hypothetical protein